MNEYWWKSPPWIVLLLVLVLLLAAGCTASIDMSNDAQIDTVIMRNGYKLQLTPGIGPQVKVAIADEGKAYPVIALPGAAENETMEAFADNGILLGDVLDTAVFSSKVEARGLPYLEDLVAENKVISAVALPPEAKIGQSIAERVETAADSDKLQVVVHLFEAPTAAERETIKQWLAIEDEAPGPVHLIQGTVQARHIESLANLSLVAYIEKHVLSSPSG